MIQSSHSLLSSRKGCLVNKQSLVASVVRPRIADRAHRSPCQAIPMIDQTPRLSSNRFHKNTSTMTVYGPTFQSLVRLLISSCILRGGWQSLNSPTARLLIKPTIAPRPCSRTDSSRFTGMARTQGKNCLLKTMKILTWRT